MDSTIEQSKSEDLKIFKEDVKELLEQEIVSRYYYQRGLVESSFDSDSDVEKALEILKDPQVYGNTLMARK